MNEMNQKFCQCCGMPMGDTDELYGTNADGSKPTAANAVTDYEIAYQHSDGSDSDTLKKGATGAGYDNGIYYLETNNNKK